MRPPPPAQKPATSSPVSTTGEPAGGSQASTTADATDSSEASESSAIEAALAKLSPADRALAVAQKICPVSKKALGSMDAPVKVSVKDKEVFICCDGCREELESDPDKYLAELDKK